MREVFRSSPQDLRRRRRRAVRLATDGGLALRLPVSTDYDWASAVALLEKETIPGVETVDGGVYRRTITLDGDPGMLEVRVERVRRMLGLDFDIAPAVDHFTADPVLGPLVKGRPGTRVQGAWGPLEAAVRIAIDRHHNDARRLMGRLAAAHGTPVPGLPHGLSHAFPAAPTLAGADLRTAGLPAKVAGLVARLAESVTEGGIRLDGSVGLDVLMATLTSVPGIDATTAQRIAMRLGERDAYPAGDPALPDAAVAECWRPWRALAATHLLANMS
jgi:AraC family transcriptional regulator of adaptative response / DNA-3-methyladenine glycosylase II